MGLLQRLSRRRSFNDEHSVLLVVGIGPDGDRTRLFNDVGWFLPPEKILLAYTKELYSRETAGYLRNRFGLEAAIRPVEIPYPDGHPCRFMREAEDHLRGYPGYSLIVVCEQLQAAGALATFIDCKTQETPRPEPGDVYLLEVGSERSRLVGGTHALAA